MPRRALNVTLLALTFSLAACDATVVLGTDCPPRRGVCLGDCAPGDEPESEDARSGDAHIGALDGDVLADAHVDAGPAIFPPLENRSFELRDGGVEGGLPLLTIPSPIAPWYACRTGLSTATSMRAGMANILPTDGATFLADSFPIVALNLNGLNQDLTSPLRAGQRYAFVVDLWAEGGSSSDLELQVVAGTVCLPTVTPLGSSGPLPNGGWQRRCIRFTPVRDVSTLALMVNAPDDFLNFGARLYVDNIRSEPDCH